MTQVLLVAVNPALGERIASRTEHWVIGIDRDSTDVSTAISAEQQASFSPDLVIVGSSVSVDRALEYAEAVVQSYPLTTVLLEAEPDRGLIRKATRSGVRGVIAADISDSELTGLLERSGAWSDEQRDRAHRVIVCASPKGGVGKTTTAISLAALLAEDAPQDVVVIDLDLQFGDVSAVLDLTPQYTVTDAFASGADDSMLLRTLLTPHAAGFYVLCGSDHPAENGKVTGDEIRKLISKLSDVFGYVIVDTAAGLHEDTLSSLEEATDIVLLSTLDVATLRAVRKEIDVLAELRLLPHRRHIVVNRTDRMAGLTVHDAETMIGLPVDVAIESSDAVLLAANHGTLAVAHSRRNRVRAEFGRLADRIRRDAHAGKEEIQ